MGNPLVDPTDLGTYLNDATINTVRAELMISQAQTLCEDIVSPLTDAAAVVVLRVAARGYTTAAQARGSAQMAAAGSPFQTGAGGGIYLDRYDRADLRRSIGGGSAFSIDLLPTGYVNPVAPFMSGDFQEFDSGSAS